MHIQLHWHELQNATGNSGSSLWVPVAAQLTGDHMGSHFIPRIGQEVLVDFIDGNADQPIIVGAVYNGSGQVDAAGSSTQPTLAHLTANAPVFYADGGSTGNSPHDDVIYGIKSQSMGKSQTGDASKSDNTSGYSLLAFDHSLNAARIELSTTAYASQLQLGATRHQNDNIQRQQRGPGFALETQAAGQLRGSQGVLLSSHSTAKEGFMQNQAAGSLQAADQLQQTFNTLATTHKPVGIDAKKDNKAEDSAEDKQQSSLLATSNTLLAGGFSAPQLVIESPTVSALLSPESISISSSGQSNAVATSVDLASQGELSLGAAQSIALFSQNGLNLISAHGVLGLTAHQASMRLDAKETINISSNDKIVISAPDKLEFVAAGSAIKLEGSKITHTSGGKISQKAPQKKYMSGGGASNMPIDIPFAPMSKGGTHNLQFQAKEKDSKHLVNAPYLLIADDGTVIASSKTTGKGKHTKILSEATQNYHVHTATDGVVDATDKKSSKSKGK